MHQNLTVQRIVWIDTWRGAAVIGMIIFHIGFFLNYFGITEVRYFEDFWLFLARLVQWSFLLLVGIGIALSYQKSQIKKESRFHFFLKQMKKGLFLLGLGFLIMLFTLVVFPEDTIYFGILHLIGTSLIFLSPVAVFPSLVLFLAIVIFLFSFEIFSTVAPYPFFVIFGFKLEGFRSLDYFPLFPWMTIPALGIFLASRFPPIFFKKTEPSVIFQPLIFLGRHSLLIYFFHVPIIIFVLFIFLKS